MAVEYRLTRIRVRPGRPTITVGFGRLGEGNIFRTKNVRSILGDYHVWQYDSQSGRYREWLEPWPKEDTSSIGGHRVIEVAVSMWTQITTLYPGLRVVAHEFLIEFPSSYSVNRGFIAVTTRKKKQQNFRRVWGSPAKIFISFIHLYTHTQ